MEPVPSVAPDRSHLSRMALTAIPSALFVLSLLLVHVVDLSFDLQLARFGLLPRHLSGLRGILFAPLLHGDWEHLFNNAISAFALVWALMFFYGRVAGRVLFAGWFITGVAVWALARPDLHIGASGLIYTIAAFLFTSGILRRQRTPMALALIVVFLYGSMLWGVLPVMPRISWESHMYGAVIGIVLAIVYRKVPASVQDPVIVLDDPEEEDEVSSEPVPSPHDQARLEWERKLQEQDRKSSTGSITTTWDDLG